MDEPPSPTPTRAMLEGMHTEAIDEGQSFDAALAQAREVAKQRMAEPMMLAFWDGSRAHGSPAGACGRDGEPGWMLYAKTRGADLAVHSPDLRFVFLFLDAEL